MRFYSSSSSSPVGRRRRLLGMTLVEVMMASALSGLALGALLVLVAQTAKEQRRGVVDASLQQQAGALEDKLVRLVRSMSATESTLLADPIQPGSPMCRRVIMGRGPVPAFPREELSYDPTTFTLVYEPNRAVPGNKTTLFKPKDMVVLRGMYFFAAMKNDGSPDNSLLNVWMEFDDDGHAGRKVPGG